VLAEALAAALDDEPAGGNGIFSCPMDNGSSAILYFVYGKAHSLWACPRHTLRLPVHHQCRPAVTVVGETGKRAIELRSATRHACPEPVALEHPRRARAELAAALRATSGTLKSTSCTELSDPRDVQRRLLQQHDSEDATFRKGDQHQRVVC
jgi:hypothetical protein